MIPERSAIPRSSVTPALLIILDGFGCRAARDHNAVALARTPYLDRLFGTWPHTRIDASEGHVGLPAGQMGNSEVGHMNIGSGRIVYQDVTRIDHEIATGGFDRNPVLAAAVDRAADTGKALHLLALVSDGGVHASEHHLQAMLRMAAARGIDKLYVHAIADGRDTPPQSAHLYLDRLEAFCRQTGRGRVASLIGRYFAMDRDRRWKRVERAWRLFVRGEGDFTAATANEALDAAYARGETDEFIQPTLIVPPGTQPVRMQDGDVVVFLNFRSDRARELTRALATTDFADFERPGQPALGEFVCMTRYDESLDLPVAYPPQTLCNGLGQYISSLGLSQFRIAETEKYAHVTYFFNGGNEQPFPNEVRQLVPSPQVDTYDMQPEMSAPAVTDALIDAIESRRYQLLVCNYANGDMVGHTGNLEAAVRAVEALDACLARVIPTMLACGGEVLLTADHGNAEDMFDEVSGQPHTAHTLNPVPLIYMGRPARMIDGGRLADIAPTLLAMMGLPQPPEMTGRALVDFESAVPWSSR